MRQPKRVRAKDRFAMSAQSPRTYGGARKASVNAWKAVDAIPAPEVWPDIPTTTTQVIGDDWDTMAPASENAQVSTAQEDSETTTRAEWDQKLSWWPGPQSVTIGPYCINESAEFKALSLPPHNQPQSPLMRFLSQHGIEEQIIDILFENHSTIWKFAFTCQKAYFIARSVLGLWDMTASYFNDCEKQPTAEQTKVNADITSKNKSSKRFRRPGSSNNHRLNEADIARQGTIRSNLVISYLRGELRDRMESTLYESQIWATYQLCQTVHWRGDFFRRIHLHRIPFLTTDLITILVPQMTNLEMLGIYRCPLIHVGNSMRLLEIIQLDRMKGRENQVSLDFYPRLHVGPIIKPGNPRTRGGFGATWENWQGQVDIAIYAIVFRFAIQSKLQGFDVLLPHCQFRKWLEDGPCWDVANTLDAMAEAFNFDRIDVMQKPNHFKVSESPSTHADGETIEDNEYHALYPELTRFILQVDQRNPFHEGDMKKFFRVDHHKRPEGCEWTFHPYKCTVCETTMPGIFFQYRSIKEFDEIPELGLPCLGCLLTSYLQTERDHFKLQKNNIMNQWIIQDTTPDGVLIKNTDDLGKLLTDFISRDITLHARALDHERAEFFQLHGYDKETQELQKPMTEQVQRSRRGEFLSAPMIGEWADEKARRAKIRANPELASYYSGKPINWMNGHRHYG